MSSQSQCSQLITVGLCDSGSSWPDSQACQGLVRAEAAVCPKGHPRTPTASGQDTSRAPSEDQGWQTVAGVVDSHKTHPCAPSIRVLFAAVGIFSRHLLRHLQITRAGFGAAEEGTAAGTFRLPVLGVGSMPAACCDRDTIALEGLACTESSRTQLTRPMAPRNGGAGSTMLVDVIYSCGCTSMCAATAVQVCVHGLLE